MKKSIIKKSLFLCLLIISATCFSYLSLYGTETAYIAQSIEYNADVQTSAINDVNGMKDVIIKILKMMMLKF